MSIYMQGRDAFNAGTPVRDNPYALTEDVNNYSSWLEGWCDAQYDDMLSELKSHERRDRVVLIVLTLLFIFSLPIAWSLWAN